MNSTATTFGAKINICKLRTNQNIKIIWRLRIEQKPHSNLPTTAEIIRARLQPESSGENVKEMTPIRPVALLPGSLGCRYDELYQLM